MKVNLHMIIESGRNIIYIIQDMITKLFSLISIQNSYLKITLRFWFLFYESVRSCVRLSVICDNISSFENKTRIMIRNQLTICISVSAKENLLIVTGNNTVFSCGKKKIIHRLFLNTFTFLLLYFLSCLSTLSIYMYIYYIILQENSPNFFLFYQIFQDRFCLRILFWRYYIYLYYVKFFCVSL